MKNTASDGQKQTRVCEPTHFQGLESGGRHFSNPWKNRGGLCAALLAASVGGAWAQSSQGIADLKKMTPAELMAVEVQTVTTASKKEEKTTEAPATVIVITANDIRLRGYSMLTDVLRDLPGMETIPHYFSEFGTQVPVRGIQGNNKIVVLVNGMRVNPPGGENFPFRSDFSVRDAERIEIIYGPGSTLYGQDAISAVINVITKQPLGDGGEVGAGAGNNATREGWGSFGSVIDREGRVKLSGYAQYHDSDLTRLDEKYPKWWVPYRALAEQRGEGVIPARQDFGLNAFGRLDVYDSSLQIWNRSSRRSSSESGYPPAYVEEAVWQDESTVIEGRNTLHFSDAVKLESAVTFNRYEIDPSTRYVFNTPTLTNSWFLNDFKYGRGQSWSLEETLHYDVTEKLALLAGASAGSFDIIPKSTVPGGADPSGNVVRQGGDFEYTVPGDPTVHTIPRVVEVKYATYAAYGEADLHLSEKLSLIAGTRVTKDTRFDDIPFTPRAALVYKVTDEVTAKYIYTRAYVAPAPYFGNATYANSALLATSNPNLKPEKSETHEVNLTYNQTNLSLGASVYYGKQHDIITVSDRDLPQNVVIPTVYLNGDPNQPLTLVRASNGGSSDSYGADLYGRATLGAWSSWFSYSYVNFQEKNAGMTYDMAGASKHNGRLGVTWAITDKLYTTPSLVIRSTPENTPGGNLANELKTPWEIDWYTLYQLTAHMDLFADLRNVTDHHYALAGFGAGGLAIPQETFNGMVGLKALF